MRHHDNICRELISTLATNIDELQMQVYKDENRNLNTQIIKVVDPVTGQSKLEQKVLGTNFETQSIQSGVSYKMSAVGEMNNEELD